MSVEIFNLGPLETNCYLIYNEGEALAIDPGGNPASVVQFLQKNSLKLCGIYLTHLHFDHLYGVADLHEATNAPIYYPTDDAFLLDTESGKGGIWGFPAVKKFDGENLMEGPHAPSKSTALHFTCISTPGHTPGGVSLYFPDLASVFTGDSLFYRAVGRSDLPGGDHNVLIQSIRNKLFTLPDNTMVYPGHGPESSIAQEKAHNPYCSI